MCNQTLSQQLASAFPDVVNKQFLADQEERAPFPDKVKDNMSLLGNLPNYVVHDRRSQASNYWFDGQKKVLVKLNGLPVRYATNPSDIPPVGVKGWVSDSDHDLYQVTHTLITTSFEDEGDYIYEPPMESEVGNRGCFGSDYYSRSEGSITPFYLFQSRWWGYAVLIEVLYHQRATMPVVISREVWLY